MNSALSSFLQSEINNIAGAMRSMGLDIGMSVDNSVNANELCTPTTTSSSPNVCLTNA